jgi:asparagine synthase (glutamine-hydrolysing)
MESGINATTKLCPCTEEIYPKEVTQMCGICGILKTDGDFSFPAASLSKMLTTITHRGPDDQGIFLDNDLALGMQRLSIIDLSTGQQPMFNEDGTVVVVCNGEIYNYKEITQFLRKKNHVLKTTCDTEVLAHLYEEFGKDFVNYVDGMFSIALWDKKKRTMLLVRDRLGIKPLYYFYKDRHLVFASEIKAILQAPEVPCSVNLTALSAFLTLKYVPAPQTMFADINALEPGHRILFDGNNLVTEPYWDISYPARANPSRRESSYIEELESLLMDTVRSHLMSDVPFGAFLSGGIDSSVVVAMMSQYLRQPVQTFSVGYSQEHSEVSELQYANLVARQYQTDQHDVIFSEQDFIDLTPKLIWYLDQPIADQASLATYKLSQYASQYVKMVLTGEGGDELFAGYARYPGEKVVSSLSFIPVPWRIQAKNFLHSQPGLRRWKHAFTAFSHRHDIDRLVHWFCLFSDEQKHLLLTDSIIDELAHDLYHPRNVFQEKVSKHPHASSLNRMLYVDTKLWLPDDLLARGDKTSMAASIEGRVPLLSHHIVEFAASLPDHLKLKQLTRKYLLKKVAERHLPKGIIYRKKAGFPMPVAAWMRDGANAYMHDVLSSANIQKRGYFNNDYVQGLMKHHETGQSDYSTQLWALMNVELWHQTFFDQRS